jgi:DNA integrity scanning protein DisA with diadenylate cyclase activity
MYLSALDVSFTKTGGLIACIDKKNIKDAQTLFSDDIICNGCKKQRIGVFKELIAGKKFQDLSRSLRAELIAIDGATIIDSDGNVLAVGAIVKLEGGSSSGGRKAATKALSEYGTAIKISNDSYIEGFRKGAELFKI